MKRRILPSLPATVFLIFTVTFIANAQQQFKATAPSTIGYLEYLPQDYDNNSDKYPVVIFLHGIGERGTNTTDLKVLETSVQTVTRNGPPKLVKYGQQFPFILISPQLKVNFGYWPTWYVMEVINYVKTYLRIDEKRIYLTGLSLGGGGAWTTAQDHPELFAALAPVCGGFNDPPLACNIAAENLPVWAFHGDADPIVPLWRTVNMVNAINNCSPTPVPRAKLTVYEGVDHNSWSRAYRADHSLHNPNVYEWMLSFSNTINAGNKLPVANAGADKTFSSTGILLAGNGTDADGVVSSYEWKELSGPNVATLEDRTTASLHATGLTRGRYVFSLQVTDDKGGTDTDYVTVTINGDNRPPVVNAGSDQTVYNNLQALTLSGTATDTDGTITEYAWTKLSGPDVTLTGVNTPNLSMSPLEEGIYTFRLTATDNGGGTAYDDVQVTVKKALAPVADAGEDKLVLLPSDTLSLVGRGQDPDGEIVSYRWTERSGATCAMEPSFSRLRLSGLTSGTYVFSLTVEDNSGLTHSDDVVVNVTQAPVVDAGPDQSFAISQAPITITGSARDADGVISSYRWVQSSGPEAVLDNDTTAAVTISGVSEGIYIFIFSVSDNFGVTATDSVSVTIGKDAVTGTGDDQFGMEKHVLGDLSAADLEDCIVSIFNGTGEKIFSGAWSRNKFQEIFRDKGLYIYQVIKNGKRINTGKIYFDPL